MIVYIYISNNWLVLLVSGIVIDIPNPFVLLLLSSYLYQIAHLGDDDDEPEFSSAMPLEEGDTFLFQPRALKNLVTVDEMDSLTPITHCQVCIVVQYYQLHWLKFWKENNAMWTKLLGTYICYV